MATSLEELLVPQALRARTRTKYVPLPTPVATNPVAVVPVSLTRRFAWPGNDPASMMYEVGEPLEAFQATVTVDPLTANRSPLAAAGGALHTAEPPEPAMKANTSFEDGLVPASLTARTRT